MADDFTADDFTDALAAVAAGIARAASEDDDGVIALIRRLEGLRDRLRRAGRHQAADDLVIAADRVHDWLTQGGVQRVSD